MSTKIVRLQPRAINLDDIISLLSINPSQSLGRGEIPRGKSPENNISKAPEAGISKKKSKINGFNSILT